MNQKLTKLYPWFGCLLLAGAVSAQSQANIPFGESGTKLGAGVDKAAVGLLSVPIGGQAYSIANEITVSGTMRYPYSTIAAGGTLPATIQAGTYALKLRVGDTGGVTPFVGLNDISAGTNTDPGAVAGFFTTVGTGADTFLAAEATKNNMYTEFNSVVDVTYAPPVEADPVAGEWTTWTFRWTVASGSSVIGTDPFLAAYGKTGALGGHAVFDDSTLYFAAEGVNEAPIADDQTVKVFADVAMPITLTGFDVEGSSLSYTVDDTGIVGALTGTAPNLTYTPLAAYTGPDSFTFIVNDGALDSAVATVTINVETNVAPVAIAQTVSTIEVTPLAITLTGSDSDGGPSALTYTVDDTLTVGTVTGTAPNLTYTAPAAYIGSDSFTFIANDGFDDSASATITIDVVANVVPVADAQSVSTIEETPLSITLTGSDSDGGPSALTYSFDDTLTLGAVTGTAPNLTYTAPAAFIGEDSFTFTVNDGLDDSTSATITIDVTANVVPVADAQSVVTPLETDLAITLTGSDADGGPNALTYSVDDTGIVGALTGTAPNLTYTPLAAYTGPDSFTFTVNDGLADSAPATITIDVQANVAPIADAQSVVTFSDTALAITLTGSDPDSGPSALTYTVDDTSTLGAVTGTAPNLTYTPPAAFTGDDSFTFTVNDGSDDSAPATVDVKVSGGTIGSLEYTFETPGNITGAGVDTAYNAPDVITLGPGITVSDFTMTDRDITEFSRFQTLGGSVQASIGHGGTPLTASFTITIDDTVVVDLSQISFDTAIDWNPNNLINITEGFSTSLDGGPDANVTSSIWSKNVNANYANNPANNQIVPLSGLSGLTNTTVTFTWTFFSDRNNNLNNVASGLDDIVLTGAVTQLPSIGQATIVLVSGGDDAQLSWLSIDGRTYTVEGTDDLTDEIWDPVETGILGDGGEIMKTYDITEVGDQYFFRISLEPVVE